MGILMIKCPATGVRRDKAQPINVGKQRHLQKPLPSIDLVATANCGKLPRMPRCLVHVWS